MKKLDVIAVILLIVGGLNWGLVGLFHFDVVAAIFGMKFGQTSWLSSAGSSFRAVQGCKPDFGAASCGATAGISSVPLIPTRNRFPNTCFQPRSRRQADDNPSHPYRSTRYS